MTVEFIVGGHLIIIDADDADLIAGRHWIVRASRHTLYAFTSVKGCFMGMQHIVLGLSKRLLVDHINGQGLDNRRCNLRRATIRQNLLNRGPNRNSKTGLKGVYWDATRGRFSASICADGRRILLGRFDLASEAAQAYDEAARRLFGEFAWLNADHSPSLIDKG